MLQLYDLNKNKIQGLTKYKDLKIESTLSSGDKVLSFSYPRNLSRSIAEEGYIRTKTDEYVIKQIERNSDTYITVNCNLNLEELEGKVWESFSSKEQTIDSAIKLAIAGTGWTVKNNGVTKKRTIRKTGCSALEVIQQCIKTYRVEVIYDTINKVINVYNSIGSDKGCYFTDELNLKELALQSDSYNFYTVIEAYGKGDLHCTVENYQYSKKKKALYWKDERYTDLDSLKEDATLKLKELSTPTRAYKASIVDLAKLNSKYSNILDYSLGDTVTLIDKENNTKIKQRIVKITEYPDNQQNNEIEISNTTASFEDIQKEQQETQETVSNITEDNGTISIKAMQDGYVELSKVNVQELNAIKANIGELKAGEVIANLLHANIADIEKLYTNKADIDDLNASNITFGTASGGTLDLQTLLARFVSGEQGQYLHLTGDNVVIANGIIKNAMIDGLDANKITSGSIDTNKIAIQSTDSSLKMWGDLLQFRDKDGNVRIQMGLDGNKVYSLKIADAKGNILFDTDGATAKGLHSGIITNAHVADNANINGKKIDINSLISEINNSTSIIKSSKVQLDTEGQSLDVAFNTLKSNVDNIQVGGRNLIVHNGEFKKHCYNINGDLMSIDTSNAMKDYISVTPGETLTFHKEDSEYFRWNWYDLDKNLISRKADGSNLFTWAVPDNAYYIKISYPNVGNVKLERGTKATDWSPAPEDTQEQITANTTAISVNQGKIDTLIKDTTITKDGKNITLKDAYSSLQQNVNGFETKVANAKTEAINTASTDATKKANKALSDSKGYTDNSVNTVIKRVTTAESSITQLSDSITQKVSKTEFENMQIGGRNLALRTSNVYNNGFTNFTGAQNTCITLGNVKTEGINVGDTIACFIEISYENIVPADGKTARMWVQGYGNVTEWNKWNNGVFPNSNVYTIKGTGTIQIKWTSPKLDANHIKNAYWSTHLRTDYIKSGKIKWRLYKVERGNKNTAWTPAPEDTQEQINNVVQRVSTAEQKITPDAIVSTVTESTAYKNAMNGKVDSTTYNSRITQLSNSITAELHEIGSDNLVKNADFGRGLEFWQQYDNDHQCIIKESTPDTFDMSWGHLVGIKNVSGNQEGICTTVTVIPGYTYTLSCYIKSDSSVKDSFLIQLIAGINDGCIIDSTTKIVDDGIRYSVSFVPQSLTYDLNIINTVKGSTLWVGRIMVNRGYLQGFTSGNGIYSKTAKFDKEGLTVDNNAANTKTIVDNNSFRIVKKNDSTDIFNATENGATTIGGFKVVDKNNGNTVLWGSEIDINGQRAIAGTGDHPTTGEKANTLFLNYQNDFKNGVEISGLLTNNWQRILTETEEKKDIVSYFALNNGFIIQFGHVTGIPVINNVADMHFNFPKKFPNYCLAFVPTIKCVDNQNYLASSFSCIGNIASKDEAWFYAQNLKGTGGTMMDITYIAIGY